MKTKVFIYVLLCGIIFSCTTDNDFAINEASPTTDSEVIDQDAYIKFIKSLEEQYDGKPVYHNFNRPDFSKEIAELLVNSKEETFQEEGNFTKSFNEVAYGPWGGNGGTAFDARLILQSGETGKKLTAIKVRHGAIIDAIQLYWINNKGQSSYSPQYGGSGGTESWLYLSDGEYITGFNIKSGNKVDNITFVTNYGVYTFGGPGGANSANLNFGISGFQLHGIYGRSGNKLDKIGIYCYPNSLFQ